MEDDDFDSSDEFEIPGFVEGSEPAETFPNVLLYGPPKSGKTTAALTIPGTILYLNADTANSLWFGRKNRGKGQGRVTQGKLAGSGGLIAMAQWLHSGVKIPGTIVLDPIGDIHRQLMESESGKAVRPLINTYGDVAVFLERFCRSICAAPLNVVIIAHDLPVKDDATGEVEYLPATGTSNPMLGRKIMGMVDVVGYTGVLQQDAGPRYVAQLLDGRGRHGGDRFNILRGDDPSVADLNLGEWLAKIKDAEQVSDTEAAAPQEVK